jgi:hypothetical protein
MIDGLTSTVVLCTHSAQGTPSGKGSLPREGSINSGFPLQSPGPTSFCSSTSLPGTRVHSPVAPHSKFQGHVEEKEKLHQASKPKQAKVKENPHLLGKGRISLPLYTPRLHLSLNPRLAQPYAFDETERTQWHLHPCSHTFSMISLLQVKSRRPREQK